VLVQRQSHIEQNLGRNSRVPETAQKVQPEAEQGYPGEHQYNAKQSRRVAAEKSLVHEAF
jgi:hypothetical protein